MTLKVFAEFDAHPGSVLLQNSFTRFCAKNKLRPEDMADGLKQGYEFGWLEDGPNKSIKLTDSGFAEINMV
ncbi:MAG: hypothetical protein HQ503_16290 [Rhodospirillales bacterium]|nr:hypothetical protein [Rhodospirillales bacterium]